MSSLAVVCPGPVKQCVRIGNLADFEYYVTADRTHPTHRFVSRMLLMSYPGSVSWIDVWPDSDWHSQPQVLANNGPEPIPGVTDTERNT
jgi:hypothetical protein